MVSNKTVLVEFPQTGTNDQVNVPSISGFYDKVERIDCYSNSVAIESWTGSADSRVEFYSSGSLVATYPGGSMVNGGASVHDMDMIPGKDVSMRWFHNQNAFTLPSVKNCTVVLGTSNWFAEFAYSEGYNSMAYTAFVVVFVAFGAWIGKRIAQGKKTRKNNRG